ncbi:MAG: metallophosphoesterase family protein [Phycisphaerales bacterium]|nr:metallophosphoesterase family protein [Phycisphaerales bacterium]
MAVSRRPTAKYRRAKMRHFLFTTGPDRLSGGRIVRKHFDQTIRINELEISSPRWPMAFDGLRVGHISDFHLGDLMPLDRAQAAVELLAGQNPDLIACTGDIVDLDADGAEPLLQSIAGIKPPMGSYLVLGNHDELDCANSLSHMAIDAGITMLRDSRCSVACNGERLNIAGIDWARTAKRSRRKVDHVCDADTHLLLAHNPKAFPAASHHGIPLTLSGHTHGGQVALPRKPGGNLALAHRRSAGVYARGDSRLFVTVGVGAWFPLRVNCPAEVAMITMRSG